MHYKNPSEFSRRQKSYKHASWSYHTKVLQNVHVTQIQVKKTVSRGFLYIISQKKSTSCTNRGYELHSSVGGALHRYRAEVTGSNPAEGLNFFQASLSQLLKLRINREDLS